MLFRTGHRRLGVCHVLQEIRFMRLGLLSGSLLERNDAGWGFGPFLLQFNMDGSATRLAHYMLSKIICRFVKHIGQGRRREPLWEQPKEEDAWDGSCLGVGGKLPAHQSRRGNRNGVCRRNAFGPHDGCVPPFRCGGAYRGE